MKKFLAVFGTLLFFGCANTGDSKIYNVELQFNNNTYKVQKVDESDYIFVVFPKDSTMKAIPQQITTNVKCGKVTKNITTVILK